MPAATTIKTIWGGKQDEKKRYKDLDCALTDCLLKSKSNKIIVSKIWNKDASDATDYIVEII